jgi:hypothetical protein
MSNKNIFIVLFFLLFSNEIIAQLKVDAFGRIGMGTNWPNKAYKCHIKGNLLLSTYPERPVDGLPPIEFRFLVGNGFPGAEMGSNIDKIAFWYSGVGYNALYASKYLKSSDASLKVNKSDIEDPLGKLMELSTYKYDFKDQTIDSIGDTNEILIPQYGFISQEVEQILTDIKITENLKGIKLMDYDQIIPLLVSGIQAQQTQLEYFQSQLAQMMLSNAGNTNQSGGLNSTDSSTNSSKINSISPNPFNNQTTVNYEIHDTLATSISLKA